MEVLGIDRANDIITQCHSVRTKWWDLGIKLGVLYTALEAIEANHRGDVGRSFSVLISTWLRRAKGDVKEDVRPTWKSLCVALSYIDQSLAETIATRHHGCGYINPIVSEVAAQPGADPPAFLPKSCGCGRCTVQGWATGRVCQNVYHDRRPKLLVVDPSNPQVTDLVRFEDSYDRQAKLCVETNEIVRLFVSVSHITWKKLASLNYESVVEMALSLSNEFGISFPIISDINGLHYLVHSLKVSWFNFEPLRFLAFRFLLSYSIVLDNWENYTDRFIYYCQGRNLKRYTNIFFQMEQCNVFLLEVDECYNDFTLSDIKDLRKSLSTALDIHFVSLHLVTVRTGSLFIYFHYGYSDYLMMFQSLSAQKLREIASIKCYRILTLVDFYGQFKYENIQEYYHLKEAVAKSEEQLSTSETDKSSEEIKTAYEKLELDKNRNELEQCRAELEIYKKLSQNKDMQLSKKGTADTISTPLPSSPPTVTPEVSMKQIKGPDIRHTAISPTASAVDIFTPHSAKIKSLIHDPTRLGNDLVSVGLIDQHVVDGLASQRGVSDYDRASKMVSVIQTDMSVSQQSSQILLDLCKVLRNQKSKVLNEIVDDIERQLGTASDTASAPLPPNPPTVTPEGGLDTVTSPVPPVTSDTGTETNFHGATNKEQSSTTKFKGTASYTASIPSPSNPTTPEEMPTVSTSNQSSSPLNQEVTTNSMELEGTASDTASIPSPSNPTKTPEGIADTISTPLPSSPATMTPEDASYPVSIPVPKEISGHTMGEIAMPVSTACNRVLGNDDINKVTIACKPIQGEWDQLGQYLNVTPGAIKTIKADYGESAGRLMGLINTWVKRERKDDRPSWRKLCEALENINMELAEKIAGEHQCSHGDCKGTASDTASIPSPSNPTTPEGIADTISTPLPSSPATVTPEGDATFNLLSSAKLSINRVWGIKKIRKECGLDGSGTVIAILDTEVDWNHPELLRKTFSPKPKKTPSEEINHGTVCAIIAAGDPNGIAPKADLLTFRVASDKMSFSSPAILKALRQIQDDLKKSPVDVISMSFDFNGTKDEKEELMKVTKTLSESGVVLVAAAGNDGNYHLEAAMPAKFKHVISVGALNDIGERSRTNPPEDVVDVYAPGEDGNLGVVPSQEKYVVTRTAGQTSRVFDETYDSVKGSFIATPVIAGIVSMLIQHVKQQQQKPELLEKIRNTEVLKKIFNNATTPKGVFHPSILFKKLNQDKTFLEKI